ncbi:MAG TPA: NAD(+)/NADH kinase [Thermoplasmata archaeon]
MRIGLTANPKIPGTAELCGRIVKSVGKGHEVVLEKEIAAHLGTKGTGFEGERFDVILAVGGDGTILRAFQLADGDLLGINSGSLGFLAEIYGNEVDTYLPRVLARDYTVERRMRIEVEVDGRRRYDCLNEAVVHTAHISKIRSFEVRVDGQVAERVRSDGIIVATPTGSTSYSMSVGGPIVDPRLQAIIVTAIAPFKPAARPYVFPPTSRVDVQIARPKECLLVLDGQHEIPLRGEERLSFTSSDRPARFIRFRDDFYQRIEQKLAKP